MPVHLEGEHGVFVDDDAEDENIEWALRRPSKLLAWFDLNQRDMLAHEYTYDQIPEHYVWVGRECKWQHRQLISKTIGQLAGELYHLHILLRHTKGATSFADTRTVGGRLLNSYFETCRQLHLIDNTDEYVRCLQEIAKKHPPARIRRTFALLCCIVMEAHVVQIPDTFDNFKQYMIADHIRKRLNERKATNRCVRHIAYLLQHNGKDLHDFGLPLPDDDDDSPCEHDTYKNVTDAVYLPEQLNDGQR